MFKNFLILCNNSCLTCGGTVAVENISRETRKKEKGKKISRDHAEEGKEEKE